MGFETVEATVEALAPGTAVNITTSGLFASGKRFLGIFISPKTPNTNIAAIIANRKCVLL
jgi:hypothetical protein